MPFLLPNQQHQSIEGKIESVSLRKCPYDHWLANKVYLSAVMVTNISESFTYKLAAKINWHRYGTEFCHYHPLYATTMRHNCCHWLTLIPTCANADLNTSRNGQTCCPQLKGHGSPRLTLNSAADWWPDMWSSSYSYTHTHCCRQLTEQVTKYWFMQSNYVGLV